MIENDIRIEKWEDYLVSCPQGQYMVIQSMSPSKTHYSHVLQNLDGTLSMRPSTKKDYKNYIRQLRSQVTL